MIVGENLMNDLNNNIGDINEQNELKFEVF